MSYTLYHYVHCPFCIRVRMALGYLGVPFESVVLSYDDEVTPVKLTGKKMLPAFSDGKSTINESLDIIALIDREQRFQVRDTVASADFSEFEKFLAQIGSPIHSLAMPYWIYTAEFTPAARAYFQRKKEEKRGPFRELLRRQGDFVAELAPFLKQLEGELRPYYRADKLGLKDLMLAAHLWGLYVVPEFRFSQAIHDYLQTIKRDTNFNYHQDFIRML
jgi:glutaredoxin 2